MGGHSHWAGIKHKKAIVDAKRGKIFTKILREITIAAKLGGGDIDGNARLRKAVEDAKGANMPLDNVKRAIQKGTGQIPGAIYEELTYEGYGPAKVAVIVETTTDNKNRTFAEIRKIFDSTGGALGSAGCVSYMFQKKGYISVAKEGTTEDQLMDAALEAGAEDVRDVEEADYFEVITGPAEFDAVKKALEDKGFNIQSAEVTMLPDNEIKIDSIEEAKKVLKLIDQLEDHDDTKNVYANFDIPEAIIKQLE